MKKSSTQSKFRLAIIVMVVAALALAVFGTWISHTATIDIPKPSGPHLVGFTSKTMQSPTRAGRVLTLDMWYPASSTQGHKAEAYIEESLAELLAKYQGIPTIGGELPSYSFRDAPMLNGQYPVVVFNHGYGSFTKQNFSNFQAFANQGWLVISIGHPGESLLTRDASGAAIIFDNQSPIYQRMTQLQTKDPKSYAHNLAGVLQKQRVAATAASHQQASQEIANIAPYDTLAPLVSAWEQDTRDVIANLPNLANADASRVVVMGHSLGGVVALQIAKKPPTGVRAIVNLDAPWLRYGDDTAMLQVPALFMLSTQNFFEGENLSLAGTFDPLFNSASPATYVVEIAGSAHFNFTDLSYAPIVRFFSPVLGNVDATDMTRWQREALSTFLQRVDARDFSPNPLLPADVRVSQRYFAGR